MCHSAASAWLLQTGFCLKRTKAGVAGQTLVSFLAKPKEGAGFCLESFFPEREKGRDVVLVLSGCSGHAWWFVVAESHPAACPVPVPLLFFTCAALSAQPRCSVLAP